MTKSTNVLAAALCAGFLFPAVAARAQSSMPSPHAATPSSVSQQAQAHPVAPQGSRAPEALPTQVIVLPPRVVVLPVEQVGSTEPGPQSPEAARQEAWAAMAEARQRCRVETDRQQRADCLSDAREDRDRLLEAARGGRAR